MKKSLKLIYIFLAIVLFSCEPNITNPVGTGKLGSLVADGQKVVYVAIGNSLTAGMQGHTLYTDGQQYSFPNLLAKQLKVDEFVQPSFPDPGMGEPMTFHGFTATGSPIITQQISVPVPNNLDYPKPFNNLGVPGAIAYDLIDESDYHSRTVSRENPFYDAVLRSKSFGKTILDQAIALQPNLITLGMGNNDILGYATSGGTISTTVVAGEIVPTPTTQIQQILFASLKKLKDSLPNTKIILFNIPDVTGTPFFKVIPWNALVLDATQSSGLTALYKMKGLPFSFQAGQNGFIAESPKSPGKVRQLTQNDYVLLTCPQDSLKAGWGSLKPIPNQFVLDSFEVAIVRQSVQEYNGVFSSLPATFGNNVKVMDMNTVFSNVLTFGYKVPGSTTMMASFISGEMFSLDGIHPSSRGYGMITNEIIKFINTTFGADIPLYPLQNLPAITVKK